MVEVIISWLFIGTVCMIIGNGVFAVLEKIGLSPEVKSPIRLIMGGVVLTTVLAEIWSIFAGISLLFWIFLLMIMGICLFFFHKKILIVIQNLFADLSTNKRITLIIFILLVAFFTSRGTFHTDTNIYHANNIRIYEEIGLIKGMANLQWQFGYNSSYLAFASVFSFGWLFSNPIHTTTGFLELIIGFWAIIGASGFNRHKRHVADMCKVGIIVYILVIITGSMSPATDYGAMLVSAYIISRWMEACENKADVSEYALLSVLAVFGMTMKISTTMLVIAALYPLICLIHSKMYKKIIGYVFLGILQVIPFFVRNYLISGWLVYPFSRINIFNPDWKIPKEVVDYDAAQITTWGRELCDAKLIDTPFNEWISIWWSARQYYEKMLIYSCVIGVIVLLGIKISELITKGRKSFLLKTFIMYLSILMSIILWFAEAPFIRYGLAFILFIPLMAIGELLSREIKGVYKVIAANFIIVIILCITPYLDDYVEDFGVFMKHNIKEPYYLLQKNYDYQETDTIDVGGISIAVPILGELNSYYSYPSSAYEREVKMIEAIGTGIEDGFKSVREY